MFYLLPLAAYHAGEDETLFVQAYHLCRFFFGGLLYMLLELGFGTSLYFCQLFGNSRMPQEPVGGSAHGFAGCVGVGCLVGAQLIAMA